MDWLSLIFPNLGNLESYIPINSMCFGVFSREFKAFHFSKRTLCVATAHNKWLKKVLGMYNNFESCLPSVYKFGMIYTLVDGCFCICLDLINLHTDLTFLKRIFHKIGYPEKYIFKCLKSL